jgi:hypothetical protein
MCIDTYCDTILAYMPPAIKYNEVLQQIVLPIHPRGDKPKTESKVIFTPVKRVLYEGDFLLSNVRTFDGSYWYEIEVDGVKYQLNLTQGKVFNLQPSECKPQSILYLEGKIVVMDKILNIVSKKPFCFGSY